MSPVEKYFWCVNKKTVLLLDFRFALIKGMTSYVAQLFFNWFGAARCYFCCLSTVANNFAYSEKERENLLNQCIQINISKLQKKH